MTEETKDKLRYWARLYHTRHFIAADPVQFPHRYMCKQDIETSGLLTAVLSFGSRRQILEKAEKLDVLMRHHPYNYILSRQWETDFPANCKNSFYRMLSYSAFRSYFERLYAAYTHHTSLEDALNEYSGTPMERLCAFLDVSAESPQKKLNMFLRWMVRTESDVDFGIWRTFSPANLLIPLDTHVCHMAHELGLIDKPVFSLRNAKCITQALAEVFPGDPCLGDFALFGYGINRTEANKTAILETKSI